MIELDYQAIGIRIRRYRKAQGLTQQTVAELLHVSQNTYSQYEIGITKFPLEAVMRRFKSW